MKSPVGTEGVDSVLGIATVSDVETDSVAVAVVMVLVASVDVVAEEILWVSSKKITKNSNYCNFIFFIFVNLPICAYFVLSEILLSTALELFADLTNHFYGYRLSHFVLTLDLFLNFILYLKNYNYFSRTKPK